MTDPHCTMTMTCGWKNWLPEPVSQYRHNVEEHNADAHEAADHGPESVIDVTDGKLDFGTWERIFCREFDVEGKKRGLVKIIQGIAAWAARKKWMSLLPKYEHEMFDKEEK